MKGVRLVVWVGTAIARTVAVLFLCTTLHAGTNPQLTIERDGEGDWIISMPHQWGQVWSIQATPRLGSGRWFTPPRYFDDGIRLRCYVKNTDGPLFFRARRIR